MITSCHLKIETENAAFVSDGPDQEVARILEKLVNRIRRNGLEYVPLMDVNGNKVGEFDMYDDDEDEEEEEDTWDEDDEEDEDEED